MSTYPLGGSVREVQCLGVQTGSTPVQLWLGRHSRVSEPLNVNPASQANEQVSSVTWSPVHAMEPLLGADSGGTQG